MVQGLLGDRDSLTCPFMAWWELATSGKFLFFV